MKVSKGTNRICLGLAIAALVAIFFYQVAYAKDGSSEYNAKDGSSEYSLGPFEGWNKTSSWIQLSPETEKHDYNDQRIEYNILNGSAWNIVNSTDGTTGTIAFDIAAPRCNYNGDRACTWVVSYWNDQLYLGYYPYNGVNLTFQKVSHDHIELIDQHGGTIHLMRQAVKFNEQSYLAHYKFKWTGSFIDLQGHKVNCKPIHCCIRMLSHC